MMNNYVYILDGKAYVNLTNKCDNACEFCIRNSGDGVADTPLWLDTEPTADDVEKAFDGLRSRLTSDEVVFCGFGEPTAALDPIAESWFYEKYHQISAGKTSVFISHRLASTSFCDRILLIENGQVSEEGTHAQLIARRGKYYRLFEIQADYYRKKEVNEEKKESNVAAQTV